MSTLRVNLDDLLHARTVESERIEFKSTWDPKVTGHQVLKTICAFANDFGRHGSGYILLGVAEKGGRAELPARGLTPEQMDDASDWIVGNCRRIEPRYVPRISREEKDGRNILVVWVPASETPPHQAPDGHRAPKKYWVRLDQRTVDAQSQGVLSQLHSQSAVVPWDSRANLDSTSADLSEAMVREHLTECGSALADEPDTMTIYRYMDLVVRVNDHYVPRNVALLFFSRDPSKWFKGASVEVSILRSGPEGDVIEEMEVKGGLTEQVRGALAYLRRDVIHSLIRKVPGRVQAAHGVNYPEEAVRELLVNALYHRGYGKAWPHTTLVRVASDRIDIRSVPGPVPGIELEQLQPGAVLPMVPPRNPRIGEFLKEIGLAEQRLTGMGKTYQVMKGNGSPPPKFLFDQTRTFFQATLLSNPLYSSSEAIRRAAALRAVGRRAAALNELESAWQGNLASSALAEEFILQCVAAGDLDRAEPAIEAALDLEDEAKRREIVGPWLEALVTGGQADRAKRFLGQNAERILARDAIGCAIAARRLGDYQMAATLFDVAGELILDDPRALLESAQNKVSLAERARSDGSAPQRRAVLEDAKILLERLLRMKSARHRHAQARDELARVRRELDAQRSPARL